MLLGVAGPGDSSPSPFHTYHILGSSSGTVLPTFIIPATCRFCNYFRLFSRFFVRFCTVFRIFGPLAPPAGRNPQQENRTRAPGTTKPPGWGREKPRTGRGARPRTAQRRGGGRPTAPIPGAERRPAPEGGDPPRGGGDRRERAADRRQGSTAARAASGRGGPPQRGDALPAKKGGARAGRPPTADAPRGCAARGKRVGVVAPPQSVEPAGPNAATPPRDGGVPAPTRPHVAGL